MKNAVLEREVIRRSAHTFREQSCEVDGRILALLTNRETYILQSRETVGKLPAHPPVPRNRSLVVAGPLTF